MAQNNNLLKKNQQEYVVLVLAIASLLISCIIISSKKFFWNDELYSYYFLSDPSFTHMLGAFHDKINNTPPLYFLLGWLWARVFGSSELSLRLFSSLGMCLACVLVWIVLRRTYSFWPTSIGTLGVFCVSDIILSQNAEARMYGLFLALCSLALLQFDINNRISNSSWKTYLSNACIHAAIVNTHLFGLFYGVAILFSQIVRDKYFKTFRPKIYLAIIVGWTSLILYIPSFLNQSDAGKPRTWIPIPVLKDLTDFLSLSLSSFSNLILLVALLLISGFQFILYQSNETHVSQIDQQEQPELNTEIPLLILAYSFLAVPLVVWVISRTIKPIFIDRYMIPSALSWSILLAYLSSRITNITFNVNKISDISKKFIFLKFTQRAILLITLTCILLIQPISYAKNYRGRYMPGLNDNKYGYRELPIVIQASAQFIERLYYSPERDKYFFILDWEAAVDQASGLFGSQEYKHIDALNRNYPNFFKNHVVKSEDFLKMHNRFLILDYADYDKTCPLEVKGQEKARKWEDMHCPQWVEMRLLSNPHYKVTHLGDIYGEALLLVEKQK